MGAAEQNIETLKPRVFLVENGLDRKVLGEVQLEAT